MLSFFCGCNMKGYEFYGLMDFFPNREIIRNIFQSLNKEEKRVYKMYVYSLPFMEDNVKDLIWEYLNYWQESQSDLAKKYRLQKEKNNKRFRNEISDNDEVR